jgi:hypothetical protein
VEQYLCSDSLIYVCNLVSGIDRDLVEHLLEPAMYLKFVYKDFYAILEPNKGMVIQIDPDSKEFLKYLKQEDDFEEFPIFEKNCFGFKYEWSDPKNQSRAIGSVDNLGISRNCL